MEFLKAASIFIPEAVRFIYKNIVIFCRSLFEYLVQLAERSNLGGNAKVKKGLFPVFLEYWWTNDKLAAGKLLGKKR